MGAMWGGGAQRVPPLDRGANQRCASSGLWH